MPDAYEIMSYAKRSGARAQQQEDWQNYQDELTAFQEKEGKAGFWGGLASIAAGIAMPALLPALASGGLGSMLMMGAVRGGATSALGELGRSLAGGGGGIPTYKATGTGPYGRVGAKTQQRQADVISRNLSSELKGAERNRMFTSMLSGFMPEFKKGGVGQEKLKGLFGKGGVGPAGPGTSIIDGSASIRMPGGQTYGSASVPSLASGQFGVQPPPGFFEAGGKGANILGGIGSGIGTGMEWGGQAGKSLFDLLRENIQNR